MKLIGTLLVFAGASSVAFAAAVPEINPSSAGSALALLSGALLIMRSRRK